MPTLDPKVALEYLAKNAQRVIPLADVDNYNAAVKAVGECVDYKLAQDAIAKDVGKTKAPTDA
jgi:hypothetical protein